MVDIVQTVSEVARSFQEKLGVRSAYGEPISANGVTVVPVARVAFGFGGGGGGGTGTEPSRGNGAIGATDETMRSGSGGGGGGGGGGAVQPIGFIEITELGARWVPVEPSKTEMALRALMALAVVAPGGRGAFWRRLALMLVGQALIGRLAQPRPSPADGFASFGRRPVETPA
jgi:uncharacterized spore protein YtfJ